MSAQLYAKDRPGETAVVARSMVGRKGLDDLETFVWDVLDAGVPGDFMETGVWQGGSCICKSCLEPGLDDLSALTEPVGIVDKMVPCLALCRSDASGSGSERGKRQKGLGGGFF